MGTHPIFESDFDCLTELSEFSKMAEIHYLGEIATGFGFPENKLCVRYKIKYGAAWKLISGNKDGQTQTDWPQDEDEANFNHFLDLHFGARGIQGWPQIMIQVYLVDSNGRRVLYGYGSSILPITAGYEEIEIGTWRPADQSIRGRLKSYLLDSSPELAEPETIISSATQQRQQLAAEAMGYVKIKLYTVLRNFKKYGIET